MNKILRKMIKIATVTAAVILIYFILTVNAIDMRLSAAILQPEEGDETLVHTEYSDGEMYGAADRDVPCLFTKDGKLMLAVGTGSFDVTPAGINIAYYGSFMDFNEQIKYKKNCSVSDDGRYIVYRLEFNEIPYLYYFDVELGKAFYVTDRADSFDIMENDGNEALTLVYATGYEQSNKLYAYRSDVTGETAGTSDLLAESISAAGIFEAYSSVVYVNADGELFRYDGANETVGKLADGVEKVYFPGKAEYNYDDYYDDFTVCCRRNGEDVILNGASEAPVTYGYYGMIPEFTHRLENGDKLYYTKNNKRITCISEDRTYDMYPELGDIYRIFGCVRPYSDGTYMIAATKDSLYLLNSDGEEAVRLMTLPLKYRKNTGMLEEHMSVYEAENGVFYVNMLTGGSFVLNPKNTGSWMNGINSYNYGLTALVPSGASYSAEELNVPPSRRMSAPAPAAANDAGREYVYISYFEDGSVRSASLLSGGSVLYEDILGTSALAEKQLSIEVFPCGSGTYFVTDKGESGAHDKELYVLRAGSDTLEPVYVGSGQTEGASGDFDVGSSFGTLVIFGKERYN